MNGFAIIFTLVTSVLLLSVPRQWAPLPLLIGACYMTLAQGIVIGPFNFTVIRILIAVGVMRIFFRGEWITGGLNGLDWWMVTWALWALLTGFFHPGASSPVVFRLGLVYNTCGIYFLFRVFFQSIDDVTALYRIVAIMLLPIAFEMIYEQLLSYNLFSTLGGVPVHPHIRDGNIRAQGPFRHAILAGTVGAVCLPLMVALWNRYRKVAIAGVFACVTMVFCSYSSGPLASAIIGIGALFMWRYREKMRVVRWAAVVGYIVLDLVMKAPAYFLMAKIPLVPGSTGWHRAELIHQAFKHISEWWLWGTDYTRHWMPTGVSWSKAHTDITNHYIKMGVIGGLPLMLLLIVILVKAFSFVGKSLLEVSDQDSNNGFVIWATGASLFANAATMISVSYFDQSFLFLYLTLAAIGSIYSGMINPSMGLEEQEI